MITRTQWITVYGFFAVIILICVFKIGIKTAKTLKAVNDYPILETVIGKYHSTKEIYDGFVFHKSPFYQTIDLSPQVKQNYEKILAFGPTIEKSRRVLIICGQHGRELVSSELCHSFIQMMMLKIQDVNMTIKLQKILLEDVGIWVVPVNNPWSRQQVEKAYFDPLSDQSLLCTRTNKNGVDLNRNFPLSNSGEINLPG
jgi:murein tripeptide amidase MpaA